MTLLDSRRDPAVGVRDQPIRRYARFVVFLRFPIALAWMAAVVAAVTSLPALSAEQHHGLHALVPADSPALAAELESIRDFGYPLLARTVVVQRDPNGLSTEAQARAVMRAVGLTRGEMPELRGIAAAVPATNALGLLPSAREQGTTALTYLFFSPDVSLGDQELLAERFVREQIETDGDEAIGVTGAVPGRLEQAREILGHLTAVEILTVAVIAVIVGAHFRSVGAPALTLAAAAIAYLLSTRALAWGLARSGGGFPEELGPLMVVLLLGIVTDYSIFFLEHARKRLRDGASARDASRHAASEIWAIVVTAGIAVAAGAFALLAAEAGTYRALGPGLALAVLIGLAVTVTFVPAMIGVFGGALFWPSLQPSRRQARGMQARAADPMRSIRSRITYAATSRWLAVPIAVVGIVALGVVAWGARSMQLGFSLVGVLPDDSDVKQAAVAAGRGFAPGIVSPAMLVLNAGEGDTLETEALGHLQSVLEEQAGVAGVLGPREVTALDDILAAGSAEAATGAAEAELPDDAMEDVVGAFVTPDGTAGRMLLILDTEPLGAPAIETIERLRERLPSLLSRAGLDGVRAVFAGDTALAADTIEQTLHDLRRVGLLVVLFMLLLLVAFLRAAVAPVYLLAISLLAFLGSLSITAFVFREFFGVVTTSFFVPFASAVLLVSLGSDYNIFLVGRIWDEARWRPLREAIAVAAPDASRAIATAGITLAASFAVLAIIPITPMRQFAFTMAVGILLDTFLVRSVIVPAVMASIGPSSAWPGRFRRPGGQEPPPLSEATSPAAA